MPPKDYSKTQIYLLKCKDLEVKYGFIGATTNFRQQIIYHTRMLNANVENELYNEIRSNGGWDNWEMTILEEYSECKNKTDSNNRVKEWIVQLFPQNLLKNSSKLPQNSLNFPQNTSISLNLLKKKKELECNFCNKTYSRKDNLKRHLSICKYVDKHSQEIIPINQSQIATNINNETNTDNSTTNTTNTTNTNNNSHNTTNNTLNANNTVNNYNIVSFGEEDYSKIFKTKKDRLDVLKRMHTSLLYKIEKCRCNKEYPELQNVVIKNMRDNNAYVYDEKKDPNNFILMSLEIVLDLIINTDFSELESEFEEIGHELDPNIRIKMGEFIRQMNEDPEKIKYQKDEIKRSIYNYNREVKTKKIGKKKSD